MYKTIFAVYVYIILDNTIHWCNTDVAPATGLQRGSDVLRYTFTCTVVLMQFLNWLMDCGNTDKLSV